MGSEGRVRVTCVLLDVRMRLHGTERARSCAHVNVRATRHTGALGKVHTTTHLPCVQTHPQKSLPPSPACFRTPPPHPFHRWRVGRDARMPVCPTSAAPRVASAQPASERASERKGCVRERALPSPNRTFLPSKEGEGGSDRKRPQSPPPFPSLPPPSPRSPFPRRPLRHRHRGRAQPHVRDRVGWRSHVLGQ
jgi:hypothetical protein